MTEKRFKLHIIWYNKEKTKGEAQLTDNGQPLLITDDIVGARLIKDCLNDLNNENEQLKTIRSDLICELDIVQNELNIAIDKGFAPSKPYKNYMASKKTEYDKFWENKIKTHNNRLKELRE